MQEKTGNFYFVCRGYTSIKDSGSTDCLAGSNF